MRKVITVLFLLIGAALLFAADDSDVTYTGGTAQLKEGSAGRFDLSSSTELRFVSPSGALAIPYSGIESFEHTKEASVHLGVAPAIAVGLVAARKHNHFVRITYKDSNSVAQVAVFEVPKSMTAYLMPTLEARSPHAQCMPYADCPPRPMQARILAPGPQPTSAK